MRIYLAGPMRGRHLFNFPAFFEASERLQGSGHTIFNPAAHDMAKGFNPAAPLDDAYNLETFSLAEAFNWDFRAILRADAIVLLPGWEQSKGCQSELVLAKALEREVYEYDDGMLVELEILDYDVSFTTIASQNEDTLIEDCGHHGESVYDPEGGQDVAFDPFSLSPEARATMEKAFETTVPALVELRRKEREEGS